MQHVDRDTKGVEVKTDVDVITDADCITMDDGDLRSGVKKMIDDRIGEVIDGAPKELDTLKEIATELEKNQSGVSTILKAMNDKLEAKDLKDYAKTTEVDEMLKSKVSAVNGKELSTNDFTDVDKRKLDAIENGAQKNTVTSVNGMTGAVTIEAGGSNVDLSGYAKTSDIKTKLSEMADDSTHRLVTDVEKTKWNGKASKSDIKTSLSQLTSDSTHRTVTDEEKSTWDDKVSKTEIADFKRCIVLTQSEYNALSTTKKNRADTLYFIKE